MEQVGDVDKKQKILGIMHTSNPTS